MKILIVDVVTMAWNDHRILFESADIKGEIIVKDTINSESEMLTELMKLKRGDEIELPFDEAKLKGAGNNRPAPYRGNPIRSPKKPKAPKAASSTVAPLTASTGGGGDSSAKPLSKMNLAELKAHAESNGIALAPEDKTKALITAKIEAAAPAQ